VLYSESSRDRFEADVAATLGEQRLAADASMFNAWLQARAARDPRLQATFVRRFSPEYRGAFEAGTVARETADRYVRVTVVFALVLFLVAVGQRFKLLGSEWVQWGSPSGCWSSA
jgi:hypothetical protein